MNTHQCRDKKSEQDTNPLHHPRGEVRLVTRGGSIHLELVMPTQDDHK